MTDREILIQYLLMKVRCAEQDYERMRAAAQAAYRAMVAMELSDGSKREWDTAIAGLREALKSAEVLK